MNDKEYQKFFCSKELEEILVNYDENIAKNNVTTNELKIEIVENGIVYPLETVGENKYGGVVDSNGNFIELSSQDVGAIHFMGSLGAQRYKGANPKYKPENIEYIDEEVVFIGCLFGHYMHMLLESISRLWYYLDNNPKYKAVCILEGIQYFYEILDLLNFPRDRLICIDKPKKFKKIIVPETSLIIYNKINVKHKKILDNLKLNVVPANYKKVYFSRNHLPYDRTMCEKPIEEVFKSNGFKIIYPEELSLKEKISILKGCDTFAGLSGSNSHLAMFLEDGSEYFCLSRSKHPQPVQGEINILNKLKPVYVEAFFEITSSVRLDLGPHMLGGTEYLFKFFDYYNMKYNINDFKIKYSDIATYITTWASANSSTINPLLMPESISTRQLLNNIASLPLHDDIKELQQRLKEKYDNFILFGKSSNKKYIKIFIFGLQITFLKTKLIDKIVWWIPTRKLRYKARSKLLHKFCQE